MSKYSFIQVFAARKETPGKKGWIVRRVKRPTTRSGTRVLWSKKFQTETEARKYAAQCRKRERT